MALNVIRRDRFTPSGMVVHQHDGGGGELECPFDHFARIDRRVVDGSGLLHLVGDQRVTLVEEQHAELLLSRTPWRCGNSRARATMTTAPDASSPGRAGGGWQR